MTSLPFYPDGSVDLVVCRQWLQLLADRVRVLADLTRVLAPGGRLAARAGRRVLADLEAELAPGTGALVVATDVNIALASR